MDGSCTFFLNTILDALNDCLYLCGVTYIRCSLSEKIREFSFCRIKDGELFGIDQTFWDTPFTRKAPIEPRGHHLHAQRPVRSSSIMRSSMISGIKGIEKRHNTVASRAGQVSPRNT